MRYAVVIEKAGDNYSAYVPDLPGCIATGEIVAKLERELSEAIRFHIEGLKEDELPIRRRARSRNISRLERGYPFVNSSWRAAQGSCKIFRQIGSHCVSCCSERWRLERAGPGRGGGRKRKPDRETTQFFDSPLSKSEDALRCAGSQN